MPEFVSKSAIKLGLLKAYSARLQAGLPGWAEEITAAAQNGGVEAVNVVLEDMRAELDDFLATTIAELSRAD